MKYVVGNVCVAQTNVPENTNHQTRTKNRFIDKVRRLRLKYDNVCHTHVWTVGTFIIYKSKKLSFMVNHSSFKTTLYGIVQLSRYLQQN